VVVSGLGGWSVGSEAPESELDNDVVYAIEDGRVVVVVDSTLLENPS